MNPATLFDPVALAIVAGGTALAAVLRTPARDLLRTIRAMRVLGRPFFSADPLLHQLAALSRIAQRHGVISLDRSIVTDPDLAAGIADIVDGLCPEEAAQRVRDRRHARTLRHQAVADIFAAAAESAPAMGMIGTLVGLARMFAAMEDDAAIGAGMAVALLATLYGALLANLVLLPIAARLRAAGRVEAFERARLDAPLAALAAREAPRRRAEPHLQSVA